MTAPRECDNKDSPPVRRMADIRLEGTLHVLTAASGRGKLWLKKYCVLYGGSPYRQATFVWYDSIEDRSDPCMIYVDSIKKIEIPLDVVEGHEYRMVLALEGDKEQRVSVSPDTWLELVDWMHAFHVTKRASPPRRTRAVTLPATIGDDEPYEEIRYDTYQVKILVNEAARRCNLPARGLLVVSHTSVDLYATDHKPLFEWDFANIRSTGYTPGGWFLLVAGRKSSSGVGEFLFRGHVDGRILSDIVRGRLEEKRRQERPPSPRESEYESLDFEPQAPSQDRTSTLHDPYARMHSIPEESSSSPSIPDLLRRVMNRRAGRRRSLSTGAIFSDIGHLYDMVDQQEESDNKLQTRL